jgi:hypothetical protein
MRSLAFLLVGSGLTCAGCGLALDYGPPQQRLVVNDGGLDAARSRHDGGGAENDGGRDAGPFETDAIIAVDAITGGDATSVEAGSSDTAHRSRGDCDTSSDCPGGTCVELVVGGYRVCRHPPMPATHCDMPGEDQCCTNAMCPPGQQCFLGPIHPVCVGVVMLAANECAADQCTHDSDCPSGICVAAGIIAPVATCLDATCRHDADCTEGAGGACVLARDPCCSLPLALVCTYPSDGCASNVDCAIGRCEVVSGRARCVPDPPLCPA